MIKKATLNAKLVDFNFDSLEPSVRTQKPYKKKK